MIIECTKEKPWDKMKDADARVRHMGAKEVGDQEDGWPGGDWVRYECPHCGTTWKAELAQ